MKAIRILCMAVAAAALWGCSDWPTGWPGGSMGPSGGDRSIAAGEESYTILLCPPFFGADHVRDATEGKRKTEEITKWSGVYVVHEERSSSLYMGRYAEASQASADLAKVRPWRATTGEQPFAAAIVTRLAGERVGRPEWDLAGAIDPNWCYTVVIAEFYNVPEMGYTNRKQLAAANCEDLRAKGVEAYYYHGPAKSFVTIGAFPVDAFKSENTPDGHRRGVFSNASLKKLMHDYPYLAVNGYQAKIKGTQTYEGTYVQAISEYCVGKAMPPPARSRYWNPSVGYR